MSAVHDDEIDFRGVAEVDDDDVYPWELEEFYWRASDETARVCEQERRGIAQGRRERMREEAQHFRSVRDALRRDNLMLKDWCAAAGENYFSVKNAINYLERCEEADKQAARAEIKHKETVSPEPNDPYEPEPKPRPKPEVRGKALGFHPRSPMFLISMSCTLLIPKLRHHATSSLPYFGTRVLIRRGSRIINWSLLMVVMWP